MISKKFLTLSLLLASGAKAESECSMINTCCAQEAECAKKVCCSTENCDGCRNCKNTEVIEESKSCETQEQDCRSCDNIAEVAPENRCEVAQEQESTEQCTTCVRNETEAVNSDVVTYEPAEETEKRVKSAAVLEVMHLLSNGFKVLGNLSHVYLGLQDSHKAIFAKTITEFLFDVQKEIVAHKALFEKIGPDYVKACENLKINYVQDESKSENENLKAQFLFTADHVANFYLALSNVYKNLSADEQNELAQLFADVYLKQKEVCKDNAPVLSHISEALKQALQVK